MFIGVLLGQMWRNLAWILPMGGLKTVIAKLSPSFSFSWAELVFNLNFAPPIYPRKVLKWSNSARFCKAKLINSLSRPINIKLFKLEFNFNIQLQALTSNLNYNCQFKAPALAELGPAQPQPFFCFYFLWVIFSFLCTFWLFLGLSWGLISFWGLLKLTADNILCWGSFQILLN